MGKRSILKLSPSTRQSLSQIRPRMRGLFHLVAAIAALPTALSWTLSVQPGQPRLAVAAFSGGVGAMFAFSALLHLRAWRAELRERLLRLDHCGIYLAIGGTGVALALLGLEGWPGRALLIGSIIGTLVGIVIEWLPFASPKGFNNAAYLTLGWTSLVLLPWLWSDAGSTTVWLLLVGGLLYTVGAIIVGLRRPNPWPRWFGYHELFHALVIAAVIIHGVMLARLLPDAPG
ncbi:MAG: hemolysin III family protein [Wenzhouxiangellaceae bacterium]|nr:hemolysin III family protein [Wenzhouxiangellaceae bacterium]